MAIVRALLSLLVAALLVQQALRSADRPHRRWALVLGAALFGVLAVVNALAGAGVDLLPYATALTTVGVALMALSLALLFLAWRAGELRSQVAKLNDEFGEERKKRGL
jgi:nicotinamide riboside transporter PnuC